MAKQVPCLASRKMTIVDTVELEFTNGMSKVEFLVDVTVFINISCCFVLHVELPSIKLVSHCISKMYQLIHPRQGVVAQHRAGQLPWLSQEGLTFGFTFFRIWVC